MKENDFILMLEDDPDDRIITGTTMTDLGFFTDLRFVNNSHEFFSVLEKDDLPKLILLDYNSAPQNAVEILKTLKSKARLQHIPVVVLSETSSPKHVQECYRHGANSYIIKPSSIAETKEKIKSFFTYWLNTAEV